MLEVAGLELDVTVVDAHQKVHRNVFRERTVIFRSDGREIFGLGRIRMMQLVGVQEQKEALVAAGFDGLDPVDRFIDGVVEHVHRVDEDVGTRDARSCSGVNIESTIEAVNRVELNTSVERCRGVAFGFQNLRQREGLGVDTEMVRDRRPMVARKE